MLVTNNLVNGPTGDRNHIFYKRMKSSPKHATRRLKENTNNFVHQVQKITHNHLDSKRIRHNCK